MIIYLIGLILALLLIVAEMNKTEEANIVQLLGAFGSWLTVVVMMYNRRKI